MLHNDSAFLRTKSSTSDLSGGMWWEVLDVFQPMPSLAIARQGELFGVSTIRRVVVVAENGEPAAFGRQFFAEPRAEVSGRTLRDIRDVRVNLLIAISTDVDHSVDQLGASG